MKPWDYKNITAEYWNPIPIEERSSDNNDYYQGQIKSLKQILSQSTPLIPEIEKVYNYNLNKKEFGWYISNLKLDI